MERVRRLDGARSAAGSGAFGGWMGPGPARSADRLARFRPPPLWDTESIGAWRSLVARTVRVGEVPGSNPGAPTQKTQQLLGFLLGGAGRKGSRKLRGGLAVTRYALLAAYRLGRSHRVGHTRLALGAPLTRAHRAP